MRWVGVLLAALVPVTAGAVEVDVVNRSVPTTCAEVDNVDVRLRADAPLAFAIEARHPGYIDTIVEDNWEHDFSGCPDFGAGDPVYEVPEQPVTKTLWEDDTWILLGLRWPSFWRPNDVPFRVGEDVFEGLHLIQLGRKHGAERPIEILVLYPPDGYWRAKPLPPQGFERVAFGSSFLIGPVEDAMRPIVRFDDITFDPDAFAFHLTFAAGGSGSLTVAEIGDDALELDVALELERDDGYFAALRSMFVSETNADVATARWRTRDGTEESAPIMDMTELRAAAIVFGRTEPSQHNTSAPDMAFGAFQPAAAGD